MSNHRLAGEHVERSLCVCYMKPASQHNGVLFEFRRLSRFLPSCRTSHVGYAHVLIFRIHPSNVFINDFGHVSCGLNSRGTLNK